MRRPAHSLSLSPRVLKQFVLITVIGTGLLALFADGENSELEQAIQAREARNQLLRKEAIALGARSVARAPIVANEVSGDGYERLNDTPDYSGGVGAGFGQTHFPVADPAIMAQTDDQAVRAALARANVVGEKRLTLAQIKARSKAFKLTREEIEALKRAAREREGEPVEDAD